MLKINETNGCLMKLVFSVKWPMCFFSILKSHDLVKSSHVGQMAQPFDFSQLISGRYRLEDSKEAVLDSSCHNIQHIDVFSPK